MYSKCFKQDTIFPHVVKFFKYSAAIGFSPLNLNRLLIITAGGSFAMTAGGLSAPAASMVDMHISDLQTRVSEGNVVQHYILESQIYYMV
jgi:hypothetical protein